MVENQNSMRLSFNAKNAIEIGVSPHDLIAKETNEMMEPCGMYNICRAQMQNSHAKSRFSY